MPRLTRIYTRSGDDGSTGLGDGSRLHKDSARIQALGDIDELNCAVGILRALPGESGEIDAMLESIQHRLFDLGGELALPGQAFARAEWTERLEGWIDQLNAELPALQEFILPGGSPRGAQCHLARAICRRAERSLLSLHRQDTLNCATLTYLNRLSDLLFVMARSLVRRDGGSEVQWQKDIR